MRYIHCLLLPAHCIPALIHCMIVIIIFHMYECSVRICLRKSCCFPYTLPVTHVLHTFTALFCSVHRTILRFRAFLGLFEYILFLSTSFLVFHLFVSYIRYSDILVKGILNIDLMLFKVLVYLSQ